MQSSVASVLPTPTADLTSRLRQLMQLRSVYPEIQRGSFFFSPPYSVFSQHTDSLANQFTSAWVLEKYFSAADRKTRALDLTEELQMCDHREARDLTSRKPSEELTSWSDDVVVAVTVSLGEEKNWVTVGEGDDCYWSLENFF